MQRHGDQLVKGGIALLQFGGNDCDFNWAAISRDPAADHLPQVPLKDFIQQYKLLIQRLSDLGYQPLVLNLPPLIQDRFFATVSKGLAADTILEWLGGTTDSIYYWHQSYSDAVEQMALKAKLPLIDIRTVFEGEPQVEDLVCEDGIHPNEKGHALIARTLKAYR
ncbi:MAG TPA: SGNH/GDSL hydrolase family protein [Clostridiaceae bacterium]|nr:SGNH/GDSL hydrolase family protein [Clostridiaceae bacterium]